MINYTFYSPYSRKNILNLPNSLTYDTISNIRYSIKPLPLSTTKKIKNIFIKFISLITSFFLDIFYMPVVFILKKYAINKVEKPNIYKTTECKSFNRQETLEAYFSPLIFKKLDAEMNCGFNDYREPNEQHPENIKCHLNKMETGLIVVAGSERGFYAAHLSPEDKCTGVVFRDINPKIKAYVDFIIMLLKISNNQREFCKLSENPSNNKLQEKIKIIFSKIRKSACFGKDYYLKHLPTLANSYFHIKHLPQSYNPMIDYRTNNEAFLRLQYLAKSGKLISTLGDIRELEFLENHRVSLVDSSNICDYVPILNLKISAKFPPPRVVWTTLRFAPEPTSFFSYIEPQISEERMKKFISYLYDKEKGQEQYYRHAVLESRFEIFKNKDSQEIQLYPYNYRKKIHDIFAFYAETTIDDEFLRNLNL